MRTSALSAIVRSSLAMAVVLDASAAAPVDASDVPPAVAAAVAVRLRPMLDSQPAPLAHVHTEGTLPHRGIRDESIAAERQLSVMRDAAIAWRGGAGDAYRDLAVRYLMAWVSTYRPDFDPIDETVFDRMIDTYIIVHDRLPTDQATAARRFLKDWGAGYVDRMDRPHPAGDPVTTWNNNWESHRIKLVTMIAAALDDPVLMADARRLYRAQIAANIHSDGTVIDFAERDALHYVVYDLEPLTKAALYARRKGEDWFAYRAPTGSSLAQAFAWLVPYADGRTPHREFLHSHVAFDAARAAAGEKGYSGAFDPRTAGSVFWMASTFDPSYRALAQTLQPQQPTSVGPAWVPD